MVWRLRKFCFLNQLGEVMLVQFFWRNKFLSACIFYWFTFAFLELECFSEEQWVFTNWNYCISYMLWWVVRTRFVKSRYVKLFLKFLKLLNKVSITIFLLWWTTLCRTYSHREGYMPIWIVEELGTRRFKFIFLTWYYISLKKVWSIFIGYMWFCCPVNFNLEPFKMVWYCCVKYTGVEKWNEFVNGIKKFGVIIP